MIQGLRQETRDGRQPRVHGSAEEKFAIVMEGLKSGKGSESCRKREIGPALFNPWKDELAKGALAAPGGGPQPHPPTKSRANASGNWSVPWGGRIFRSSELRAGSLAGPPVGGPRLTRLAGRPQLT